MHVEAMTIAAFGTLVGLRDPVPPLQAALRDRGVERGAAAVRRAFEAEAAYYVPRSHEGRDAASLAGLRERCTCVFRAASFGAPGCGCASSRTGTSACTRCWRRSASSCPS